MAPSGAIESQIETQKYYSRRLFLNMTTSFTVNIYLGLKDIELGLK
jgi:hypothetical protein